MKVEEYLIPAEDSAEGVIKKLSKSLRLSLSAAESFKQIFWDTDDWRLHRAGGYLETLTANRRSATVWRNRSDGQELGRWQGKCPEFAKDFPEGEGRSLLEPIIIMRALLPQAEVVGSVRRGVVLNSDEKTVARIETIDFQSPKSKVPLPGRLRVVALRGYEKEFIKTVKTVEAKAGLTTAMGDPASTLFATLGMDFGKDPNKVGMSFDGTMEAGRAIKSVLLRLLDIMEGNAQGIIDDVDTEYLHEFRVAVRRSRSALVPFKDCFKRESFERFKEDLAWLGRDTGAPRDLDVWLLKFPKYKAMLPDSVKPQLDPLEGFLKKKRNSAYSKLRRDLKTKRYREFVQDWRTFLEAAGPPDAELPMAWEPVTVLADKWIAKFYNRLIKEGSAITPKTKAEALHDLRKTCKKFRYQIDFFAGLYPKAKFRAAAKELKILQENLGDFQDLEVQADSLRGFASEMIEKGAKEGEVYLAMGMLVSDLLQRQSDVRQEFSQRFARFAGAENQALFTELFFSKPVDQNPDKEAGA